MNSAYNQGKLSAQCGNGSNANPYNIDREPKLHDAWFNGFMSVKFPNA